MKVRLHDTLNGEMLPYYHECAIDGLYRQGVPAAVILRKGIVYKLTTLHKELWPETFTYHEADIWEVY